MIHRHQSSLLSLLIKDLHPGSRQNRKLHIVMRQSACK